MRSSSERLGLTSDKSNDSINDTEENTSVDEPMFEAQDDYDDGIVDNASSNWSEAQNSNSEDPTVWTVKPDKEKAVFDVIGWLKAICIGVLIGVLLVVFVIQRSNVFGSSMEPTLSEGDVVFAEKISTYLDNYDRGDIVLLDGTGMEGYYHKEYLVKRIVGLPGETIRISGGSVYIKRVQDTEFYLLDEPYLAPGTVTTVSGIGYSKGYDEITLSANEYFCLGDNRMISNDSRNLGPFEADRVKGVAIVRVYPFGSMGFF